LTSMELLNSLSIRNMHLQYPRGRVLFDTLESRDCQIFCLSHLVQICGQSKQSQKSNSMQHLNNSAQSSIPNTFKYGKGPPWR
jgi:hypothetical protein